MAEKEAPKSKRDIFMERLQGKYPEEQFEDDEALFGRISDDYDQHDRDIADYRDREGKFSKMFTSDPRSARLMMAWKDGDDPAVALVRLFGEDVKAAIDDPERQEAMAEANKEYMERVAQEEKYEEEYSDNLAASLTELEKAQREQGLSDEQLDQAMEWVIGIAKDAMMGKFAPETIQMAIKAQNYDMDIEEAGAEGEIRGRNHKVRETLRKPQRGDGTPQLDGKNSADGGRGQKMPDLGAIDRYADGNMNIFERGGEKRTPIRR